MQETHVQSLGQEKGMAIHSSILARRIPGQKSLEGYSSWGLKELHMTEWLTVLLSGTYLGRCSIKKKKKKRKRKKQEITETSLVLSNKHTVSIKKQRRQWHPTPVLLPGKSHGQNKTKHLETINLMWQISPKYLTFLNSAKKLTFFFIKYLQKIPLIVEKLFQWSQ